MPRPRFTLKTLLWLMAVVAAFCAGAGWQRRQYREDREHWEARERNFTDLLEVLRERGELLDPY